MNGVSTLIGKPLLHLQRSWTLAVTEKEEVVILIFIFALVPQNKHDGVLIHRDRLMDLKKRFQKKRKPSYIFETSPIFSYDERIIDIHNIKACWVPVDQDTLALVNKYFNNRQWVSK